MQKLINAYVAEANLRNAQKIRAYERAHPMTLCFLSVESQNIIADAIYHANCGLARMDTATEN